VNAVFPQRFFSRFYLIVSLGLLFFILVPQLSYANSRPADVRIHNPNLTAQATNLFQQFLESSQNLFRNIIGAGRRGIEAILPAGTQEEESTTPTTQPVPSPAPAIPFTPPSPQTIIERVIERTPIVQEVVREVRSTDERRLRDLEEAVAQLRLNSQSQSQNQSVLFQAISLTNKIDSFTNVTLNSPTISGSVTLSGSPSFTGINALGAQSASVSGALSGGTLTVTGASSLATTTITSNLGVGTTTPGAKLGVQGTLLVSGNTTLEGSLTVSGSQTISGTQQFNGGINASSTLQVTGATRLYSSLIVDGDVGIGTTSPARRLSIQGSALFSGDLALANLAATGTLSVSGTVGTSTIANSLSVAAGGLYVERSSAIVGLGTTTPTGAQLVITNETTGADAVFAKFGYFGSTAQSGLRFKDETSGLELAAIKWNPVANDRFDFYVGSSGNTADIKMSLDGTGLGLGTTSPSRLFSVHGNSIFSGDVSLANLTATGSIKARGGAPGAFGVNNNGYAFSGNGGDNDSGMFSSSDGQLEFYTDAIERVRLTNTNLDIRNLAINLGTGSATSTLSSASGNLGVGTTTPRATFAVHGNVLFSGNLNLANMTATGTFNLAGTLQASSTLQATGATRLYSTLTVDGATTLSSTLSAATSITVTGVTAPFGGTSVLTSDLTLAREGTRTISLAASVGESTTNGGSLIVKAGNAGGGGDSPGGNLSLRGGIGLNSGANGSVLIGDANTDHVTVTPNLGIGTTSPSKLLSVHGNALFSGNITSVANITATGTASISGLTTLSSGFVSQASSTVTSSLNVSGNLAASSTLQVTGATRLYSTLLVDSALTASSTLQATGAARLYSTLLVDGAVNASSTLQATGNTRLYGTLIVDGATTLSSTLSAGTSTLNNLVVTNVSTSTFAGGLTVQTTKLVVDNSTGNVGVGTTTPSKLFSVHGNSLFSGDITVANLTATGTLNVSGLTTLGNASTTQISSTNAAYFATSGGNVGIGTTGPSAKLVVQDSFASGGILKLQNANSVAGDTWWLGFTHGTNSADSNDRARIGVNIASGGGGRLVFYTGTGGGQSERVRIDDNGNLGIGTTTPNWNLQTAGTRPFMALSDMTAGTNLKHWTMSSQGGNFYVATSSDALATSTVPAITILSNGNVGIGTSSPAARLSIEGTCVDTGTGCADYAELYPSSEPVEPGDILMIDTDKPGHVKKAVLTVNPITQLPTTHYALIGTVSTNPAIIIEGSSLQLMSGSQYKSNPTKPALALAGRIPVKVNLEGGEIKAGDPITLSSEAGVGKKATQSGKIVGYALASFNGTTEENDGKVLMFVSLGYYAMPSDSIASALFAQVIDTVKSWLESMQVFVENGLVRLKDLVANKVTVQQLCVGSTCVTESELQQLLEKNNLTSSPSELSESDPVSDPVSGDSTTDNQLTGPSQAPPPPPGMSASSETIEPSPSSEPSESAEPSTATSTELVQ
jgi:hypothetical protein